MLPQTSKTCLPLPRDRAVEVQPGGDDRSFRSGSFESITGARRSSHASRLSNPSTFNLRMHAET